MLSVILPNECAALCDEYVVRACSLHFASTLEHKALRRKYVTARDRAAMKQEISAGGVTSVNQLPARPNRYIESQRLKIYNVHPVKQVLL